MSPRTNSYSNQSASASKLRIGRILLVLVIILGVFGAGTFGYLKFSGQAKDLKEQKSQADAKIAQLEADLQKVTSENNSLKDESEDQQSYLEIKEWGVKFALSEDINGIFYVKQGNRINLSTRKVASMGDYCNPEKGDYALVKLNRGKATDIDPMSEKTLKETFNQGKEINGWFYYGIGPQAVCVDDESNINYETSAVQSIQNALKSLEES